MLETPVHLPSALRRRATTTRLGPTRIPCLLVDPETPHSDRVPAIIWMHGRTVRKEIDPGRYLRLMRAGIAVCAVDLPGHGDRFDARLQQPERTFQVVRQMIDEIDALVDHLPAALRVDVGRLGIGGMSAGGMATLARLCRPHPFICASVEATTGSWDEQRHRMMFQSVEADEVARFNPIEHLDGWREIPLQAFHSRLDRWVAYAGQARFLDALEARYRDPRLIERVIYDETGAPFEHAGFGRLAADAKERQRDFFERWLASPTARAGLSEDHPAGT